MTEFSADVPTQLSPRGRDPPDCGPGSSARQYAPAHEGEGNDASSQGDSGGTAAPHRGGGGPGSVGAQRDPQQRGSQGRHDRRLESDDDEGPGHQRLYRLRHRRHDRARQGPRGGGRIRGHRLEDPGERGDFRQVSHDRVGVDLAGAREGDRLLDELFLARHGAADPRRGQGPVHGLGRSRQARRRRGRHLGHRAGEVREALLPERPAQDRRRRRRAISRRFSPGAPTPTSRRTSRPTSSSRSTRR